MTIVTPGRSYKNQKTIEMDFYDAFFAPESIQ